MGEIVGAALVSHIPPIVWPDAERIELYGGVDTSLVAGLHRLRSERLDRLRPDTVIVFDTHWFTTVEHIVSAHDRRVGLFTSDELPRAMHGVAYDMRGDPELADALATLADGRDDTWILACDDPSLPVHYPTINLLGYLQRDERWMSVGICQTGTPHDWLLFGELMAAAVAGLDRRVVLIASGGLSHRFWPLREFRLHETADPANIATPQARSADEGVLASMLAGDHAAVIDGWSDYRRFSPEGFFAHYLMMVGAIGGRACVAAGEMYSEYESAGGTGQAHVWFERPAAGWTS
jgi:aromatic ring-opening dioxygenase catalytic subunit (LigB family)